MADQNLYIIIIIAASELYHKIRTYRSFVSCSGLYVICWSRICLTLRLWCIVTLLWFLVMCLNFFT